MHEPMLVRLFAHNNWANQALIEACRELTDEQLDARPVPTSRWSVRKTLTHLVECQQGYLALLTLPPDERWSAPLAFDRLQESARRSGDALLDLARDEGVGPPGKQLRTTDGYTVEPWVVGLQALNHAGDHRRQICDMLRALGVAPPRLDGWEYAGDEGALVPRMT